MKLFVLGGITNDNQRNTIQQFLVNIENSKALENFAEFQKLAENGDDKFSFVYYFEDDLNQLNQIDLQTDEQYLILMYDAPEHALLLNTVEQWQLANQELLGFYVSNIEQTKLLNAHQVCLNLKSFLDFLNTEYSLELSAELNASNEYLSSTDLFNMEQQFTYLTENLETQYTFEQLESAAEILDSQYSTSLSYRNAQWVSQLVNCSKKLVDQTQQQNIKIEKIKYAKQALTEQHLVELTKELKTYQEKNEKLSHERGELAYENELSLLQIHQLQEELEQMTVAHSMTKAELEKNQNEKVDDLATNNEKLETKIQELVEENELSLLQIHQLQEELEHTFLKLSQAESDINSVKQNKQKLMQKLSIAKNETKSEGDQINQGHIELILMQVDQLHEELESSVNKVNELEQELLNQNAINQQQSIQLKSSEDKYNEVLNSSNEFGKEKEVFVVQMQQLKTDLSIAIKDKESLKSEVNDLKQEKQKVTERLSVLEKDYTELTNVNTDLVAENELSLLQIHQLQEELEHYYIKAQQGESFKLIQPGEHRTNSYLTTSLELIGHLNH
ncbi:coiled-coil domain-containing protein [Thalassotalea eurytherma]|uniref:Uncharacterized protein n=1 Tax=Thalassotalea eurytherma TaxID=1144278 RepID=A0ABQ6GZI1_9GAMM|nr:hypothetical protein [Thalassotalea eurytherma]GLX81300.1 hypothetical protein theurythT_07520 [Thalassotalea eurytherma]